MIDIVIVNYFSTEHLIKCLESVKSALKGLKAKIYIQDNASSDGVERIKSLFPEVCLTKNTSNIGFGRAVNQALEVGRGKYVILLNPDTYIVDDFFKISINFMEEHPDIGIMGPKILDHDARLQNSARAFPNLLTAFFGRSSFLSKQFPNNPITSKNLLSMKSDGKTPMPVDWVSGACMVVRRQAIKEVGVFDERFFMYWEDADWCKRMWAANWKVIYYPNVTAYHYVGGSSEKKVFRSVLEFHKSVYRLFDKHFHSLLFILKPLVIAGLGVRLACVLLMHYFQSSFQKKLWPNVVKSEKRTQSLSSKKIKVIRVISRMNIGGPAIHVYLLNKGLDKNRFTTLLLTGNISPNEGDMSYLFNLNEKKPVIIPELQREIRLVSDMKAFFRIFMILVREKPDILHTHTAKAGSSARFAALIYNLLGRHDVIMVHTFHGHVFEGYFSHTTSMMFVNIERFLAMASDAIVAISQTQKEELANKYCIAPEEKIKTIGLGFDLSPFFSSRFLKGQFKKYMDIDENMLLIGIVGRLVPIKNHRMFIDAAKLFVDNNPDIEVKFVIVGDGELRQDLMDYCRSKNLAESVIFCGWIKNVPFVYGDLDILALTSLNEGTPVSIIESMAASVPVIATDAGGVHDLLGPEIKISKHGFSICKHGIRCPKDNTVAFARGLEYLTVSKTESTRFQVKNAHNFVSKHYSHLRLIDNIQNLYEDLIERRVNGQK